MVGRLPFVLGVDGPGAALPVRRGIVDVAARREVAVGARRLTRIDGIAIGEGVGAARQHTVGEIVEIGESQRTGGVLREQVEHVELVEFAADRDRVIVGIYPTERLQLSDGGLEIVRSAREARARHDRTVIPVIVHTDDEARHRHVALGFAATDGALDVLHFGATGADFRGESVRPVGIEAQRVIITGCALFLEAVQASEDTVVEREIVFFDVDFLEPLIGRLETLVLGDVGIDTTEIALAVFGQRGRLAAAFETIHAAQNVGEAVELRLRHEVDFVGEALARQAGQLAVAEIGFFVAEEEEQAIADDRTAERGAPALLFIRSTVEIGAFDAVALQTVIGIGEEGRTVEVVLARLGDHVDRAARELAVLNVERREFDRGFADGVIGKRQRIAAGEGRAVEAEQVGLGDTVDREGIGTVVAAEAGYAVDFVRTVEADARIDADDVADVAADRRKGFYGFFTEGLAWTDGTLAELDARARNDDHVLRSGSRSVRQRECELAVALQVDEDVFDRLAFVAGCSGGDRVGATRDETIDAERSVATDAERAAGAGAGVGDDDLRARKRRARFVGDEALHTGGDLLGGGGRGDQGGAGGKADDGCGQQIFHLHGDNPSTRKQRKFGSEYGGMRCCESPARRGS